MGCSITKQLFLYGFLPRQPFTTDIFVYEPSSFVTEMGLMMQDFILPRNLFHILAFLPSCMLFGLLLTVQISPNKPSLFCKSL